jgi:putative oxidoreductase
VAEKILRHSETLGGISRLAFQMNAASLPHSKLMRATELIGAHVAPAVPYARPAVQRRRSPEVMIMDAGLLIVRLVFGAIMAAHGAQKLFGWFGGYGLAGTGAFFERLGFRPGPFFAALAGLGETFGGLLLAVGLFEPVGAMAVIAVMIVAIGSVHWGHGLFATTNGVEVPLLYASAATALTLTGPGAYSLDAIFGLVSVWTPALKGLAIALGVVGGFANLVVRRPLTLPA